MKKAALSTISEIESNFHRNSGRKRGYSYNHMRNNDLYYPLSSLNHSLNKFEANVIPFETSSPKFHDNRRNRQQSSSMCNLSDGGINSSCNQRYNLNNTGFSISPQKYQQNHHQHCLQKTETLWYRKLHVSEFIEIKSIFEDPWEELKGKFTWKTRDNASINISFETISEKGQNQNSSSESVSKENINISSSYEEIKESSSMNLQLESMCFSEDFKD